VLARVLLAEGRPGQALALLDRLHAAAAAQDRTGSLIEAGALRALALAASCEEPAAVAALAGTLTLACPQGYVRVFTDEGPPMAALLGRLIAAQRVGQDAAGVPLGCLARLQRAFEAKPAGAPAGGRGTAAVPGLAEALTARELEVLGMLAAGRSNQVIASELVVTLDTIKKHVSHVMDKLGAANRTEAVARARELGLIRLGGGRRRSDGTVVPAAERGARSRHPYAFAPFPAFSRGGRQPVGRVVRRNHPAVGQDLAGVVEDDHSVAEQAPALLGVAGDSMGGAAVRAVSGWAWGPVWAHGAPPGYVAAVIAVLGSSGSGGWR
jgi:DNA-binding CsgD family transcriptional regulator